MRASDYELLDSGDGRKLERFGDFVLDRPRSNAVWRPQLPPARWQAADASFVREGGSQWHWRRRCPDDWVVNIDGLRFRLLPNEFGHLGVFPDHRACWALIAARVAARRARGGPAPGVLNLFAYTGGATLAAARAGAEVCHLDASRKSVQQARDNAALNELGSAPIRWIEDDAAKFLRREVRRGRKYEGIVLDPPSFGRGTRQEVFKIDLHLREILDLCRELLSPRPSFLVVTCHTTEFTPLVLRHLLSQALAGLPGELDCREMVLAGGPGVLPVPSGSLAAWLGAEEEGRA